MDPEKIGDAMDAVEKTKEAYEKLKGASMDRDEAIAFAIRCGVPLTVTDVDMMDLGEVFIPKVNADGIVFYIYSKKIVPPEGGMVVIQGWAEASSYMRARLSEAFCEGLKKGISYLIPRGWQDGQ